MITENVSFYCEWCKLDQNREAIKEVLRRNGEEYFWAKCERCHRKLVRYITERKSDPYYIRSQKMIRERRKLERDLVQPADNRFRQLYKKQWEELEKSREHYEEKKNKERQDRLDFYRKYRHDVTKRPIVKKIIEREEQRAGYQ